VIEVANEAPVSAEQAEQASPAKHADKRGELGRVARNVGVLSVSQALTWALAVIYTLVVARVLGPAGMGALVVGWSIAGIAEGFAGLGSRPLLVKTIVRDPPQGPALIGTAIMIRAGLLIPCAVAAYAYARLGHFSKEEVVVILLSMGVALGFLVQEAIQGGLQAIERMEYLALADVINKSLLTFVSIPLALAGLGPAWLMGVNVAVMGVCVVINLVWIRQIGIDWSFSVSRVRRFFLDSLSYWAFALFYTIYLWIDSALLALFAAPQEVGWYGVSTRLFQTLMFLPVILCTAWLPRLAAAYKHGPGHLKETSELPIQLIGTLAMPIAVGTALVAGPLVVALYGPSFGPAQLVLALLALTAIPTYLNIILSQVLIAADKQAAWTKILIVASIANPALNITLIPFFHNRLGNGALGAALCMLITELLVMAIGARVARPYLSARIGDRFLRAGLVTLIMGGAVLLAGRLGVAAQIATGLLVFGALCWPAGLVRRQELRELAPFAAKVPFLNRLRPAGR
jgi:O-antigen/teichoic acid export membrane protein